MKSCHLQQTTSLTSFYEQIAMAFAFPEGFTHDMDELWEQLLEVEGPLELIWEQPGVSRDNMGEEYWMLLEILADAVAEREDFRFTLC